MSRRIDPQVAEAMMISAGLQPLEPYKNAISDWKCKCLTCKKIVISRYNRIQQGSGCPLCAYKAGGLKIRNTEAKALEKLKEYNLEAIDPYEKSDTKWKCRCLRCGEIVYPKLKNLQRGDGGCYKCGMKIAGLKNTMSQEDAIQIITDAGFEPLEPYKNALAKWKMRHNICGAIVYPKLNSIANASGSTSGCAVCTGHQVQRGFNDLATTHPELSTQAIGWDPSDITPGSNLKKGWKCSLQHQWSAAVSQRVNKQSGCPYCTGKKVLSGFNDLQTLNPAMGKQAFGWDSTKVTIGSSKKLKWRCNEGHEWVTSPNSRTNHGKPTGCPTCTIYGYDPNKDGWLYFMEHESFGYLQIGITNFPDDRLKLHKKYGWELLQLRGPMDGHLTANWETAILRMLRSKGALMGPGKGDINKISKADSKAFVGTEMWSKDSFHANSINELMRLTEEFEDLNSFKTPRG
jgi:hypothetical protein